jgi:hypothetical protein
LFISYWLIAANSEPTSWKCGVVRSPHTCPKILAQIEYSAFKLIMGVSLTGKIFFYSLLRLFQPIPSKEFIAGKLQLQKKRYCNEYRATYIKVIVS